MVVFESHRVGLYAVRGRQGAETASIRKTNSTLQNYIPLVIIRQKEPSSLQQIAFRQPLEVLRVIKREQKGIKYKTPTGEPAGVIVY
jgi:hypothetical protein